MGTQVVLIGQSGQVAVFGVADSAPNWSAVPLMVTVSETVQVLPAVPSQTPVPEVRLLGVFVQFGQTVQFVAPTGQLVSSTPQVVPPPDGAAPSDKPDPRVTQGTVQQYFPVVSALVPAAQPPAPADDSVPRQSCIRMLLTAVSPL